jgi:putative ATP-binding cassette transporter
MISLGTLMQMSQAFSQVTAALSFPVDNYSTIAQWRASVERVMALQNAMADLEEKLGDNRIAIEQEGTSVRLAGLRVTEHDGTPIMQEITAEIGPGERVLVEGKMPVCHKLILAVAGLWPWGVGKVTVPAGANTFIATDRPYLPVGTFGETVCYPMTLSVCTPDDVNSALRRVGLGDWVGHLSMVEDWDRVLSAAQRQRLSFARMLIHRPDWILLSEATNALDTAGQREMAELLAAEFPKATIVAVGQSGLFDGFFQRVLHVKEDAASAAIVTKDGAA